MTASLCPPRPLCSRQSGGEGKTVTALSRGRVRSSENMSLNVRIAPPPHHIVQEIMVNVDEDVEHEQEQARTEYALVIGKDGIDEARHAHEPEIAQKHADSDEDSEIGPHTGGQHAGHNEAAGGSRLRAGIELVAPDDREILERVERRHH